MAAKVGLCILCSGGWVSKVDLEKKTKASVARPEARYCEHPENKYKSRGYGNF